jgi:hypothetical protein
MAKNCKHLKAIALQLLVQMPADTADRRKILAYLANYVEKLMDDEDEKPALRLVIAAGADEAS